jgi:hypothetical protein
VNLPGGPEFLFVRSLICFTRQKGELFLIDDVEAAEAAEASINQFIERRAREKADANRIEEEWAISEHRHRERRREANRQEWLRFYEHMNRLHLGLAAEHADRRSRLLAECGYEPEEAPGPEAA